MSFQPPPGQPPVNPGQPANYPPPGGPVPPFGPMPGMMPPGLYPPPPMMMYPPPQPAKGGFARAILTTLATTIFSASLLLNVYLLLIVGIGRGQADPNDLATVEETIVDGDPAQKVAVVRLDGIILDKSKREFVALLDKVGRDPAVKALVLEVNSPGGGVTASDEMYDAVVRLKAERKIPVVVSMNSLAASGGYYVSMAADRILAQETTLTGSIGVIFQRFDLSGLGEKYGVKDGSIVADGATYKNAGSPLKPLTPDEEQYLKSVINDAFATFKARIAKGRPAMTSDEVDAVANGKIFSAQQALSLKLIDKVGYLDDAVADAAALANLNNPRAVRVDKQLSFFEQLGMVSPFGGAAASGKTLGVNVDRAVVDELSTPRLVYLWTGN